MCYFPFLYAVWLLINKEKEILVYKFLNKWTENSHKYFVLGTIFLKLYKRLHILKN